MFDILKDVKVLPIVNMINLEDSLKTVEVIASGGIDTVEMTLRHESSMGILGRVIKTFPNLKIGAGTVLTDDQIEEVHYLGAAFAVSPGLDIELAELADDIRIPYLPGVQTSSEIQVASSLDIKVLKFFPAEVAGGTKALKAYGGPFGDVKFCPTGGINANNVSEYLDLPNVIAVGGSWLTPQRLIDSKDWKTIENNIRSLNK